jgi:tetratricopeptide (TPR) repeat protein
MDLSANQSPAFCYYAGFALGATGQYGRAINLLKRAADGGFLPFWCAYNLGIFEMKRGEANRAASYFAAALKLNPGKQELYPLLERVAPGLDLSQINDANTAIAAAKESLKRNQPSSACFYFAVSLALDPKLSEARKHLRELAPDLSGTLIPYS